MRRLVLICMVSALGCDGVASEPDAGDARPDAHAPGCGDGVTDPTNEQCDDGNRIAFDGCELDCTFTCETDDECDDDQLCNGVESCDPETHACAAGTSAAEWTACTTEDDVAGACRSGTCAPPRCDPAAPFGAPEALEAFNTRAADEAAHLSHDELTIYYSSDRTGTQDIWFAVRPSLEAPFGPVGKVPGINTDAAAERRPSVTADGLVIYATRGGGGSDLDILSSQRASTTEAFGALAPVAALNTDAGSSYDAHVLPDHSAVYFASDRTGNAEIFRASRTDGTLGPPVPVSGVDTSTPGVENAPVPSPDELALYFSSDRAGGRGDSDIWVARRESLADPFGAAENLGPPVNTSAHEAPSWISPDGCVLLFWREVSGHGYEIFRAIRGR